MKSFLIPLYIVALTVLSFIHPSYASESKSTAQKNAILSCKKLAKSESERWPDWASQQGLTKKQLFNYGLNMCLTAVVTAKHARSTNQIEDWNVNAFNINSYFGFPVFNVDAVQRSTLIAKRFFRTTHGLKNEDKPREITYPVLPDSASEEKKVAALKEYSSKKELNGITIESRCKFLAKTMPDGTTPAYDVKKKAVLVCEGFMARNLTHGKHGMFATTAIDTAKKIYGPRSIEYRYLDQVANLAFSESQE